MYTRLFIRIWKSRDFDYARINFLSFALFSANNNRVITTLSSARSAPFGALPSRPSLLSALSHGKIIMLKGEHVKRSITE